MERARLASELPVFFPLVCYIRVHLNNELEILGHLLYHMMENLGMGDTVVG